MFTLILAGPLLLGTAYLNHADSLLHVAAAIAVAFLASWAGCKLVFSRPQTPKSVNRALGRETGSGQPVHVGTDG